MTSQSMLQRMGLVSRWSRELVIAVLAIVAGFGLLPLLIYVAGTHVLGAYEGASLSRSYDAIYQGLVTGSIASWSVVLGPYAFYLLFKALKFMWHPGAPGRSRPPDSPSHGSSYGRRGR